MAMIKTCKMPDLQTKSASGAVATFNTALAMPLSSCTSLITGYQEGSGTPSPDNVRPLHAWDKARLFDTQKNLFDINSDKITGAYIASTGAIVYQAGQDIYTEKIYIKPSTQYTISGKSDTNAIIRIALYSDNNSFIGRVLSTSMQNPVVTITPTSQASYFIVNPDITITDIQVEEGQQATAYEPFGNTYTFTFGQSIYQGSIDWKRGVVAGLWSGKVDMGLLNWGYNSNFQAFYISLPNMYIPTTGQERLQGIANEVYPISTVDAISSMDDKSCLRYNGYLWTKDSDYTDRDDFKNLLIGKYVAYELATPIEIQLSGIQIETLIGNNTIFADTGDIDLTYTDLDIAKRGSFREVFRLP